MSLAFGVENKPYTPSKPKPKGKGKDHFQHIMARVKYAGTGAVAISGKIAGTVFTNSGSNGAFIRVWAKPRNVRNSLTQLVRGVFSGVSSAWKTLTPSQITAWNEAAVLYLRKNVFGDIRSLKGNTAFQRVNNILISLGLSPVTDPPTIAAPAFVITAAAATAAAGTPAFGIQITEFGGQALLPANVYIKAYATPQVPSSQSSFGKPRYRYIGFFPPTTDTTPLDILSDYVARFGALTAGSKISVSLEVIVSVSGGPNYFGKSGLFTCDVVVAA